MADKIKPPVQSIREFCLWCCKGSYEHVRDCLATRCPLHPFRLGKEPTDSGWKSYAPLPVRPEELAATHGETFGEGKSRLRSIRMKCLDCSGASASGVRECKVAGCALWPYRMGRRPGKVAGNEMRNAEAAA